MDEHIEAALMAAGAQMQAKDAEIERLRAKLGQLVLPAIEAAVAAERERCAKLCREYAAQTAITEFQRHTASQLAAAIEGPNV